MRKAKIVSLVEERVLAAMCIRVLNRMLKAHKENPFDQRLLIRTLERLADAMENTRVPGCD